MTWRPLSRSTPAGRIKGRTRTRTMDYALPNFTIDLKGQTALVTGASSGLGLRFARTLAKAGAKVALTARRLDRLEQHAADIKAAGGDAAAVQLAGPHANQLKDVGGKA